MYLNCEMLQIHHHCLISGKRSDTLSQLKQRLPYEQHPYAILCKCCVKPVCQHYQVNLIICCPCLGLRGFTHNQYDETWTVQRLETPSMPLQQHSNQTWLHYHYHQDSWCRQTQDFSRFVLQPLTKGPFEFSKTHNHVVMFTINTCLKYPRVNSLVDRALFYRWSTDSWQMVDLYVRFYFAVIS